MRLLATVFALVIGFVPAAVHAEAFDWPGYGTVSAAVPTGWSVRTQSTKKVEFYLMAEPQAGPVVNAQFSLIILPPEQPLKMEQVKSRLEEVTRQFLDRSVEKTFDVPQSRVVVQVSDPSLRPDDAASAGGNYF